jgi:hypothetical protein
MFMVIVLAVCGVMSWLLYLAEREVWRAGR